MSELTATVEETYAQAIQRARLGRDAEAEALCVEVLERQPDHSSVRALLGLLNSNHPNEDLIEQGRLSLALGQPERALKLLTEAVGRWPNQALPLALQGCLLYTSPSPRDS